MKKVLAAAAGTLALALAAPAGAADLAARPYTKAPAPMVAAIYDWSGFYIGINGGGGLRAQLLGLCHASYRHPRR
ncbi:opacity protein-like surface antigen [Bradyrhizobium japonicum]